jgi:hypothetical protein
VRALWEDGDGVPRVLKTLVTYSSSDSSELLDNSKILGPCIDKVSGFDLVGVPGGANRFGVFPNRIASLERGAGVKLNVTRRGVGLVGVTGGCFPVVSDEPATAISCARGSGWCLLWPWSSASF